ncbi:MAG: arginine repressor [bacterium]|nr:arginine repressor [bacterium]
MNNKSSRQAALLTLVRRRRVASQEEMVRLLDGKGFSTTQASLSRDVRELGLVRVSGRYVPAGQLGVERPGGLLPERDSELIMSVEPIGANLIVVRTPPGAANAVAADLDSKTLPEISGTIAGDDTIFIAVRSRCAQGRLIAQLPSAVERREQAPPARRTVRKRPASRGGHKP